MPHLIKAARAAQHRAARAATTVGPAHPLTRLLLAAAALAAAAAWDAGHRVADLHHRLAHHKERPVPDGLYQRYQAAHRAHQAHRTHCTHCTDHARCPAGERLWSAFERLQDTYLTRQRSTR
ncbi:hypothetical protein QQY24_31895 [Streptomyces sp. TG1A-8]|uniref:hypothetical protein n=1 Tax=Streptomyces sp. TG1A-8 TaxID=3051385 RepID=UPI00265C16B3|nr:hypothetical protein [Streptomyces sp. TG1A-8]MDO0929729.1 hypothetical protein [Streptomyces sp. TG1A-8]